jgi:HlyD family secretion protein
LIVGVSLAAIVVAALVWVRYPRNELPEAIVFGNGRIEATEYDIAAKQPGRIAKVSVVEGDMVEAGQILAQMDTAELETDVRQAEAGLRQAREDRNQSLAAVSQRESDLKQSRASISQRESEINQARAAVSQRESELTLAIAQFERARVLAAKDFIAKEEFDRENSRKQTAEAALVQEQARKQAAEAMLALERARLQSGEAALRGARIEVAQREAAIDAGLAKIQKIKTIIDDSMLKSPIRGRVLYRLAEPGEVLAAGGKVLTVLDLTDVYMTIFLPTGLAGRLVVGAEARIVIDAVPQYVIPAVVSFVAPRSQFTPREVETRSEREKLMFRIKVKIAPELLKRYLERVRTGLPGVAYVKLDGNAPWPEKLQVKLPDE